MSEVPCGWLRNQNIPGTLIVKIIAAAATSISIIWHSRLSLTWWTKLTGWCWDGHKFVRGGSHKEQAYIIEASFFQTFVNRSKRQSTIHDALVEARRILLLSAMDRVISLSLFARVCAFLSLCKLHTNASHQYPGMASFEKLDASLHLFFTNLEWCADLDWFDLTARFYIIYERFNLQFSWPADDN